MGISDGTWNPSLMPTHVAENVVLIKYDLTANRDCTVDVRSIEHIDITKAWQDVHGVFVGIKT